MRILMTTNPGAGHVGPLVPFVNAFSSAGDAVLVAAPASARDTVEAAGLPFHPLGDPPKDQLDAVFGSLPALPHEEQGVRVMREIFAGMRARASLPGVLRLMAEFRPHVVLRENTEYAGLLAAERIGVPHGRIGLMAAAMETWGVPVVAPALDAHRARLGLRPDPGGDRIAGSPYLTVIPAAMEDADDLGPADTLRFREPVPAPRPLPDWWDGDERPLVYVSYGSVRPTLPGFAELFRATVDALAGLPARVLFTVGREVEIDALGPAPANVRVEPWVPQADVMPQAAAMVGHGGSGTTRMALAAGVPAVVVPGFADQPRNAERVAALGAGIALGEDALAGLGDAVRRLLDEPSFRSGAQRVAAEVAALPPVDEAPAAVRRWAGGIARAA
jgi:UDP:flavonoid glycosyltransferase YjiC (YdhE family)